MSKNKETIETLNNLKEGLLQFNEKKELLKKYGFDFSDDMISNIKIVGIDEKESSLSFINISDGSLWQSHLMASIQLNNYDKYVKSSCYSITKDNIKEQYWYRRTPNKFKDAIDMRRDDNLFLSRIYADVECKYGDFVVEFARGKSNSFGKESYIALYHGKSEDIMDRNNFQFCVEGAVKSRYSEREPFVIYQAMPNMWSIDLRKWKYMIPDSNIYALDIKDKIKGIIVEDGNVSDEYIPCLDYDAKLRLFDNQGMPRGIFLQYDGDGNIRSLSFIKKNDIGRIEIFSEERFGHDYLPLVNASLPIKEEGKITLEEISNISNCLRRYKSSKFLNSVCDELDVYCNIRSNTNSKKDNNIDLSSPFMLPITDFSKVVEAFRNSNLVELTESIIENHSKETGIDIDDIINVYRPDNIKYHKELIKESPIRNV